MKKKRAVVALLATCIAASATFAGCSIGTYNNKKDMEQVIVSVDISKSDKIEQQLKDYASAVGASEVIKRDLVTYFINVGYSYLQNNMSYNDVFNMLLNSLIENEVITQYATASLLMYKAEDENLAPQTVIDAYKNAETDVDKYEYLLGKDSAEVNIAKYTLYSSINSAIDAKERKLNDDEDDDFEGTGTRTVPGNVETEKEHYYPAYPDKSLNYNIYTGYEHYLIDDSGAYKEDALENTTRAMRMNAYSAYINELIQNHYIDKSESNLDDVLSVSYVRDQYANQLKAQAVDKYYDEYEERRSELLKANNYEKLQQYFEEQVNGQSENYTDKSSFLTAMDSMSDTSFLLYSPSTSDAEEIDGKQPSFGFVYNILLPFNSAQSEQLTKLQDERDLYEDEEGYYIARNNLLKSVTTTDQRAAWFNGETQYAFKAADKNITDYYGSDVRDYLFFEGNLTDSGEEGRYEKLDKYDGRYAYNGKAYETAEGSYVLIPEQLTIDNMLYEFEHYIDYVLGGENITFDNGYVPVAPGDKTVGNEGYYAQTGYILNEDTDEEEVDYSKLVYASGKVNLPGETFTRGSVGNVSSKQYAALSAVNELQYAYTTDTAVLSNYLGYSVSAYDTSFIGEFEYAAKLAISNGAGSFTVCAGDYGWHLIYATYVFDNQSGTQYVPDWSLIEDESNKGCFEYLFFEWMKSNDLSDISTTKRSKILADYNRESAVTKYEKRYKNLLELGN